MTNEWVKEDRRDHVVIEAKEKVIAVRKSLRQDEMATGAPPFNVYPLEIR